MEVAQITDLLQRGTTLIVVVNFDEGELQSYGTGFFARNAQGKIRVYTANHVVSEMKLGDEITLGILRNLDQGVPEIEFMAEHCACDPDVDMAVLKISSRKGKQGELRTWYPITDEEIELAFSDRLLELDLKTKLKAGNTLHMAGYPWLGLMNTYWQYSTGTVAGRAEGMLLIGSMQPFDHGQSGGPLVNEEGKVVGIADAITKEAKQANLALPTTELYFMWKDESKFKDKCSKPGEIDIKAFSGRISDIEKNPISNIQVIIFPVGTVLDEASVDDILTGDVTDVFGEFTTEHDLPCPANYVVAIIDPDEKYLNSTGEIFFDCGDYWNFQMEKLPSSGQELDLPIRISEESPQFFYRGEISYDTGGKLHSGLITVFQNSGSKNVYLEMMKKGKTEDASGLVIGAGFVQAGRYEIVMYSENREVCLLVTDVIKSSSVAIPIFHLEMEKKISLPR